MHKLRLYKNERAGDLLELSLVTAVTTFVLNRWLMELLGYPAQVRGELHFAHVLWGGLLMFIASIVFMSFIGSMALRLAAFINGIGFALFIDELGKFVTLKNDYFYRPAMAVMYIVFVAFFLIAQQAKKPRLLDGEARRLNQALYKNEPQRGSPFYRRYPQMVVSSRGALISIGIIMILQVVSTIATLGFRLAGTTIVHTQHLSDLTTSSRLVMALVIGFSLLSGVVTTWAIINFRRARRSAYRLFMFSALINILIVQVYNFYLYQIAAVGGLFVSLLIYFVLRSALAAETTTTKLR